MNSNNYYSTWSTSGPDSYRDPQLFNDICKDLFTRSKNNTKYNTAILLLKIPGLLGSEISAHIEDMKIFDHTLTLYANSTAWATQLRFLQTTIIQKINQLHIYHIDTIKVYGPKPPNWRYGPRHISGKGPRDTYG